MEKSKKTYFDILKQVRNSWNMNPRTRVQENEQKSKKKRRQAEKSIVRDEYEK